MAGTTSRIALFSASILPLMAMDPEQSSSQITWSGLPAYSPPGRTAIVFIILPLVSQEMKPIAFRLPKRDRERHGFSNRHPYKNRKCREMKGTGFLKGTGPNSQILVLT